MATSSRRNGTDLAAVLALCRVDALKDLEEQEDVRDRGLLQTCGGRFRLREWMVLQEVGCSGVGEVVGGLQKC